MVYEYISTTLILVSTVGVLWLVKYSYSVHKAIKKYAHIPGPEPGGIKGFLFGDIPSIIQQDKKGISMHQYLANL
jgi:hypothetical protein